jgi:hypothetical protein
VGLAEIPRGTKDPRAQEYVVDHVAPGARFSRRFQVCNGTAEPIRVAVYPGAATVVGGSFQIGAGRAANELTGWISIAPTSLLLQPGERQLARATFVVPADAEAGERYAVLLAELPARRGVAGIPIATRVGVRVYLDVGPGGAPRSDFTVDSLQAARDTSGNGQVTARVHNTGKRALDITGSLTLSNGPGGLSGGPYPAKLGTTLAPGDTEPVLVPISTAVADGPWTARLTLHSGLLERRVEAGLSFPDAPGQVAPPVDVELLTSGSDQQIRPARTLAVVALALLVVGAAGLVRRRRQ